MASIDWLSVIIVSMIAAIGLAIIESSTGVPHGPAGWAVLLGGFVLFWIGVEKRASSTV